MYFKGVGCEILRGIKVFHTRPLKRNGSTLHVNFEFVPHKEHNV